MGKKKRRAQSEADTAPFELKPVHIAAGVAVVVVSAIAAIAIFTLAGGADLSKDEDPPPEPPALTGEPQPAERSAAADLLSGKSVEDLSPDELELVKSEIQRAFADAEFRVRDPLAFAVDVVRRDGHTVAIRQYTPAESAGGKTVLQEKRTFYCPGADGTVDVYRYLESPNQTPTPSYSNAPFDQRTMENLLTNIDWTTVKDGGLRDYEGRPARVAIFEFTLPNGTRAPGVEYWIDAENARLLRRHELEATSDYRFDWRRPAPIEPYEQYPKPPCADDIYA